MSRRRGYTEEEVELANLIWEMCQEGSAILDARGRPSYILALNLARTLLRKAYEVGFDDPLSEIDWRAVIDCDLEYSEILSEFERWLRDYVGRTRSLDEVVYSQADILRLNIEALRHAISQLESLTPDELMEMGLTEEERQRQLEELRLDLAKLERELKRLEEQKLRRWRARAVRAREREVTRKLIEFAVKQPETKLGRYMRQTVLAEFTRRPAPPAQPAPQPPAEAKPPKRTVRDLMAYEEFTRRVAETLEFYGLPAELVSQVLGEIESDLRHMYEEASYEEALGRVVMYIRNEYIPTRLTLVPARALAERGVRVDYPREILLYGMWVRPRVSYFLPQFSAWLEDCRSLGFDVRIKPITIRPGKTHLIVDPTADINEVLVATVADTIYLVSAPAIGYVFDQDARYVEYYHYRSCPLLTRSS
jgi:DNA-binding transcriptional ArsR family regulator